MRLATLALAHAAAAMAPRITLYTNVMCPYAQRAAVALERSGLPHEKVEVDLYGSRGFTKKDLKAVEVAGGLSPKGYIPVLKVDDEVLRESTLCVDRIAQLAPTLAPADEEAARWCVAHCDNALAPAGKACVFGGSKSTPDLDKALLALDARLAEGGPFLAGADFSTADAVCLPFLWRIRRELTVPGSAKALNAYLDRAFAIPAFATTVTDSYWWWW